MGFKKVIEKLMIDKKGVVIVGIPETGEILGAVSAQIFKPDLFTGRISANDWEAVINDPDKPLVNRYNTGGLYPPGSIMK